MSERMEVQTITVGAIATNCYLAANKETKEAIIIDPGDEAERIDALIRKHEYHPVAILLTHGHFDHVLAAPALAERYGIEIYAHEIEEATLKDPMLNVSGMMGMRESFQATKYVKEGEELSFAGFSFRVILTPGHTPGGVCFYVEEENVLFSGDTIFAGSVGRTDFPKGSMRELADSIQKKLVCLPDHTLVYPGHMGSTTIGEEKLYNPYF